jgi:hypothetical protein
MERSKEQDGNKHERGGTQGIIDGKACKRQENARENRGKYATQRGVQGR